MQMKHEPLVYYRRMAWKVNMILILVCNPRLKAAFINILELVIAILLSCYFIDFQTMVITYFVKLKLSI